jgi:hypothetical protein
MGWRYQPLYEDPEYSYDQEEDDVEEEEEMVSDEARSYGPWYKGPAAYVHAKD